MNLVDIAPTLLDLAGIDHFPHNIRGRSLHGFLANGACDDWENETYSEHYNTLNLPPGRMIRQDQWKLVHYHGNDTPMLFNVVEDPEEFDDLSSDPAHAPPPGLLAGYQRHEPVHPALLRAVS